MKKYKSLGIIFVLFITVITVAYLPKSKKSVQVAEMEVKVDALAPVAQKEVNQTVEPTQNNQREVINDFKHKIKNKQIKNIEKEKSRQETGEERNLEAARIAEISQKDQKEYKHALNPEHEFNLLNLQKQTNDFRMSIRILDEVSEIYPAGEILNFLMGEYSKLNLEDEDNYKANDFSKINKIRTAITFLKPPPEEIDQFLRLATTTQDWGLFLSLTSAIANNNTQEAKIALLDLVKNNSISAVHPRSSMNTDVLSNLEIKLEGTTWSAHFIEEDTLWLIDYIKFGATDNQIEVIVNSISNINNRYKKMLPVFETARLYARSEKLKERVDYFIDIANSTAARPLPVNQ